MCATFFIDVEPAGLVHIVLSGFFTPEDVRGFVTARNAAYLKLDSPAVHATLIDIRGMKIQAQDTVAAFATVLETPRYRSRALGFIVEASLARMQLQRIVAGRDVVFFRTSEAAEEWMQAQRGGGWANC